MKPSKRKPAKRSANDNARAKGPGIAKARKRTPANVVRLDDLSLLIARRDATKDKAQKARLTATIDRRKSEVIAAQLDAHGTRKAQ